MPTYEYECEKGCRFEVQQSILDDALTRCSEADCPRGEGGVKVQRLISAANFILKGGGWYSDGYSSGNGGGKPESDSSASSSSTDSSSSESSSKSDKSTSKDTSGKGDSGSPASSGTS